MERTWTYGAGLKGGTSHEVWLALCHSDSSYRLTQKGRKCLATSRENRRTQSGRDVGSSWRTACSTLTEPARTLWPSTPCPSLVGIFPCSNRYRQLQCLQDFSLNFFIFQKDAEPFDSISSYQGFQLTHPGSQTLLFCTENENSTEKWVTALRDAVSFQ